MPNTLRSVAGKPAQTLYGEAFVAGDESQIPNDLNEFFKLGLSLE
jgi:hypothetical protein